MVGSRRRVFVGYLSRAFGRAALMGYNELSGTKGMIVNATDMGVPPGKITLASLLFPARNGKERAVLAASRKCPPPILTHISLASLGLARGGCPRQTLGRLCWGWEAKVVGTP